MDELAVGPRASPILIIVTKKRLRAVAALCFLLVAVRMSEPAFVASMTNISQEVPANFVIRVRRLARRLSRPRSRAVRVVVVR